MMRRLIPGLMTAVFLAGCTLGPDYRRPDVPVPQTWRSPAEGAGSLADIAWWELFPDDTLRTLIREALEANKDLQLAAARVMEARAQLGVARAGRFPQVDGSASYTRERISERGTIPLPPGAKVEADDFRIALDAAFELDFWGRLRRATEGAQAQLLATDEVRRTVVVTLISDVAQAYFDLLELDREREIATRTVESRRESLRIVTRRQQQGVTSDLDVHRAEGEVATAGATIPDLERRTAQTENRLSTLLGRNPGSIGRGLPLTNLPPAPAVPAGLPSALLDRRPDVRQAEQQLIVANAGIGEAKAAFFPQIALTGAFGFESVALSDLFTGPARIWQVGPQVTLPIFNAGRNQARLAAAEARRDEALIQYQQAVQRAFQDAEDALVAHRKAGEVRAQQEALVAASKRALGLAELRYTSGVAGYLDVLDAQRQLFSAEISLTQTQRTQLATVVQVYKALGGGWTPDRSRIPGQE